MNLVWLLWPVEFYRVFLLAVNKNIPLISQVSLHDGNRIIIPRGNFKLRGALITNTIQKLCMVPLHEEWKVSVQVACLFTLHCTVSFWLH